MKLDNKALVPAGAIFAMAESVEDMRARVEAIASEAEGIVALADEEGRELTDDELDTIEAHKTEADKLNRTIAARETFTPKGQGRKTAPEARGNGAERAVPAKPKAADDARGGFKSFGEFAMTVRRERDSSNPNDARLRAAATTYGNEGTGADGGFAVPTEWRTEIWDKVMGEDNLLSRCTNIQIAGNSIVLPKNEDTPWSSSGVNVYWESEGGQVSASKPVLETNSERLNKLMALVPMTEELLEDAPGMESWLRAWAPMKMAAKLNTAIVNGTGSGQPLGLLQSPAKISVAKESGQAADTVVYNNIVNMWTRLYGPLRSNAVWLINQDVEGQLLQMQFPSSGTAAAPAYMPPGGLSASPYGTLMGRPVLPVEACQTVGDNGDIVLTDLSQYMALTKAGQDIQTDVSMHLYFDQAVQAFRFIFRVTGMPMWGSAVTPENGSNTLSSIVTLAAR